MSVLVKGMEMPKHGTYNIVYIYSDGRVSMPFWGKGMQIVQDINAIPIPPHGRLIDADVLMNDGWTLYKQVMRMGGYAIHEMPLNNPNVPIVIPADKDGEA